LDSRLGDLIRDYQARVVEAVAKLRTAGVPRPDSTMDWVANGLPGSGTLASGEQYRKHGFGCAFRFADGASVDFDFGEAGQIDGVDPHRLWAVAGQRPGQYGFSSREDFLSVFEQAVSVGELQFSGYILYYKRPG
jgi:hypothetical protein